ncbi:MAG: glycosyltransferase [Dehalococcoidia bacterium]|nr:glycosyltransferase [Dehalococcoidia bacterium]
MALGPRRRVRRTLGPPVPAWLDEAVVRAAERDAIEPEPLWGLCERPQVACAVIARARDALEQASLRAALRSVAPITDECVVILDDSSAPDSDRMLEALGVRVVRRAWTRDFAAARNAVHEHTEARWLLWIDSDEVLVDAGDLRDAIARAERGGHQGVLGLLDTVGDGGPGESLRHIRVYERTCCRWKYAVHNELEGPRSVVPSTAVFHGSYVGTAEEKVARSLPMLLEQVASQPDEPRWASLLAQTYHVMGDTGEMVRWAERCIAAAPDQRAFIHRWCDLALARFTESPGQGLSTILEAVRRHPTHPDAWHALATMALARWYETAGPVESDLSPVRTARHREQLPAAARLLGLPLSHRVRGPADEGDPPPAVDEQPPSPGKPTEVEAARSRTDGLRVAFVCGPDLKFITGIEDAIAQRHEVRHLHFNERAVLRDVDAAMEWADVVWFEWCDELLVEASRRLTKRAHVVCRLHSYEAFTDAPARVDWRFVDRLVFVADHLRRLFEDRFEARPASVVIPNAVATDGLRLSTTGDPFAIAYLGSLDFKKGPQLLLQCLAELIRRDPRYHLHVAGVFGDPRYELYFDKMIPALGLQGHVTLHGWVDDVDAWLDDKSFIVSTSVLESFGVGIAEAMAKGLTPVIHDWVGAEEIWPREHTFRTVAEFADLVLRGRGKPEALRAWVRERYDLPRVAARVDALLSDVVGTTRNVEMGR